MVLMYRKIFKYFSRVYVQMVRIKILNFRHVTYYNIRVYLFINSTIIYPGPILDKQDFK